jgi:hypothetical protein
MYDAKVLADSISPNGDRLITVQATFPRFILAEVNTHRVFSRNSASSRAIPPEKLIAKVMEDPFVPETFNQRVKGMGVGDAVDDAKHSISRMVWLDARDDAVKAAQRLNDLGIDKSRVNRLLEPFMWHTAIITASWPWSNFFALRCPEGDEPTTDFPAQLEFQRIAIMIRQAIQDSPFSPCHNRDWHFPLVDDEERHGDVPGDVDVQDEDQLDLLWAQVSAGRCARVSFDTHENYEPPEDSLKRSAMLLKSGHLSPFEHQARPAQPDEFGKLNGNLSPGWVQHRKLYHGEDDFSLVQHGATLAE